MIYELQNFDWNAYIDFLGVFIFQVVLLNLTIDMTDYFRDKEAISYRYNKRKYICSVILTLVLMLSAGSIATLSDDMLWMIVFLM